MYLILIRFLLLGVEAMDDSYLYGNRISLILVLPDQRDKRSTRTDSTCSDASASPPHEHLQENPFTFDNRTIKI